MKNSVEIGSHRRVYGNIEIISFAFHSLTTFSSSEQKSNNFQLHLRKWEARFLVVQYSNGRKFILHPCISPNMFVYTMKIIFLRLLNCMTYLEWQFQVLLLLECYQLNYFQCIETFRHQFR